MPAGVSCRDAAAAGPARSMPTYGSQKIDLAKRAGQRGGWQQVTCVQYGKTVVKKIKTFLATWRR